MRPFLFAILALLGMVFPASWAAAQSEESDGVEIFTPSPGAHLQGTVIIEGSTLIEGFSTWEVTFGYAKDTTGTWFLIDEGDEQIDTGELAQWDTTTISDSDYNLRLTVFLEGGRREHYVVNGVRVRNYSPIETVTSTPTLTSTPYTETPRPSMTPTNTAPPTETPIPNTPTPLPTNPLTITQREINNSLIRGVSGAFAAFAFIGIYLSLKRILRK